jgi:hypothetical protein
MLIHSEQQLEMPRFTSTLRAFSKVSQQQRMVDADAEKRTLRKRLHQLALLAEQGGATSTAAPTSALTWQDVLQKLAADHKQVRLFVALWPGLFQLNSCLLFHRKEGSAKLKPLLDKLRNTVAKQFLNEDFNDATLLNEAAFYLLDKFYEFKATNYNYSAPQGSHFQNLDKLSKTLRQKFGPFQRNLFDNCKELMEAIFGQIEAASKSELLDQMFGKYEQVGARPQTETLFGQNIQFYSFYEKNRSGDVTGGVDSEEVSVAVWEYAP